MPARHIQKGQPVHDAEARGIEALVRALPDNYWVFSNIELASDRRGQTFEHDAIVIAPHAVFTVELKSWGSSSVSRWCDSVAPFWIARSARRTDESLGSAVVAPEISFETTVPPFLIIDHDLATTV